MGGIGATAAAGIDDIERREAGAEEIGIAAEIVKRKAGGAGRNRKRGIAAGDVGAVVDQRLGEAVIARRLHIAIGMVIHVIGGERPGAGGKIAGQFQQLMAGMQAAIIAEGIIELAIGAHAARSEAQIHRQPKLAGHIALRVTAIRRSDFAVHGVAGGAFAFGNEIDQPADLARAIDRRWRPAQNLNFGGIAQWGGIGAAIFHPLEAAEIAFRQGAAQIDRAFDAIIAGGVGRWGDGAERVHAGDAIAVECGVADRRDGAWGFQQRLGDADGGVVGLDLDQMRLVAGDDNGFDRLALCPGPGKTEQQKNSGEGQAAEHGKDGPKSVKFLVTFYSGQPSRIRELCISY